MEEIRYTIDDLSELERLLIINALKCFRGDWPDEMKGTQIWKTEVGNLLKKLGFPEIGWPEK